MSGQGKFGPCEFQQAANVSRETLDRLADFVSLLAEWNIHHNLVSAVSLADVWRRHVWDSAQLVSLLPDNAKSLADLGSGAGFPGLVLALLCPELKVVLFEATRKKCEFLEAARRRLGSSVEIRNARIEDAPPEPFDIVTARACAPLLRLLEYAARFQAPGTINLLLKGRNVGSELTDARKIWKMDVAETPSRSDTAGTILHIRRLERMMRR